MDLKGRGKGTRPHTYHYLAKFLQMDRQGPERLWRTADNNVEGRINGEMNPAIENGGDDWRLQKRNLRPRKRELSW